MVQREMVRELVSVLCECYATFIGDLINEPNLLFLVHER